MLVSLGLDQHIEDLAFGVEGSPEIDHAATNPQIDFLQMPNRVWLWAALAQIRWDHRPKMIHPASNCLIRHRDTSLRKQILGVAEAQREPEIQRSPPVTAGQRLKTVLSTIFCSPNSRLK